MGSPLVRSQGWGSSSLYCLETHSGQRLQESRPPPPSHLQTCSIKSSRNFPRSQGLLASGKYEIGDAPPTLQAYLVNPKFREHPRSLDVGPSLYLDPILSMGSKLSALRHSLTYLWDNLKELQSGELRPATFLHLSM